MKCTRSTFFLVILCATSALAQPDPPRANDNPMSRVLQRWWALAEYIVRTADSMPADRYAFKPFADVGSFREQVGHIADAHYFHCSRVRGESNPVTVQIEGNVTVKTALVAKLKESVAYCDVAYKGATDASLSEFWQQGNARGVKLGPLVGNLAHDNEHSSTMIMLMRMSGIAPPLLDAPPSRPSAVSFGTPDGGVVHGLLYGQGQHVVILGSNGCLAKEGWEPEAVTLAVAGFRSLAIDFRGSGQSRPGSAYPTLADSFHFDVLGAVAYVRATGARRVSVIGASCAGDAAAQAAVEAKPGEIDDLVLLAFGGIAAPEQLRGRKLFVVARDDANDAGLRLPRIQDQYDRSPEPKELLLLEGSAHAQRIFRTGQGETLMQAIIRFLSHGG